MWQDIVKNIRTGGRGRAVVGAVVVLILIVVIWQVATGKQRTLAASLKNLVEAESYHVDAQLDMDLPTRQDRQQPLASVTFEVNGDVEAMESSQPIFAGQLRSEARGRGIVLFADGELRLFQDAVAFRLDNLPTLLNPKGNLVEKWTFIDVPVLQTNNSNDVRGALESFVKRAEYVGKGSGDQRGLNQYRVSISSEDEASLVEIFRQAHSGNRSLHILARLLRAYDVGTLNVWADPSTKELQRITATFGVIKDGSFDERAVLQLGFTDYNKEVAIEEPPRELSVRPEVFGRIFGSGEIAEITQQ